MRTFIVPLLSALWLLGVGVNSSSAQDAVEVARIEVEPSSITLETGETASFTARALSPDGEEVSADFRFSGPRADIEVSEGEVRALRAGEHRVIIALVVGPNTEWVGEGRPVAELPVRATWPPITDVEIASDYEELYVGTIVRHRAKPLHGDGTQRPEASIEWSSSDPEVASVDRFGHVQARAPGEVTIEATAEGATGSTSYQVQPFPGERLEITGGTDQARTGDVLRFEARLFDEQGNTIEDVPISWSASFAPDEAVGNHAGASTLIRDGRFVGETPGLYSVVATAGPLSEQVSVEVEERGVVTPVRQVGQARVNYKHTSDFWVFEGSDGRDYAITGTWGADGYAYFWDVTDPENIVKYDSIQVDARTVNDVKVSPDSRYAVLTREGASDRRNGVILVDLEDPQNPRIAATYTEGLTGGVHNTFPTDDYLYALSGGQKFVILDVRDIENPRYTGEYRHPNARIHDVHVEDGIAYGSQWSHGVVIVDVGNGRWGGSPEEPQLITTFATPGGRTHAAFPYRSQSTGRFYLFLGDEILHRRERALGAGDSRTLHVEPYDTEADSGGKPSHSDGYIHIVDFTDWDNPELVARYHVPEYGTHNIWVKDDILYQAYYEGGARMVDVSGELMGNLHRQGREMAVFKSFDPNGYIANAPMVWTVYPFKDRIWFSDWNSGLWVLEMEE